MRASTVPPATVRVYTITVSNRYTGQETTGRICVGTHIGMVND